MKAIVNVPTASGRLYCEDWAVIETSMNLFGTYVDVEIKIFTRKELRQKKVFRIGTAVNSRKFKKIAAIEKWLSDVNLVGVNLKWAIFDQVIYQLATKVVGNYLVKSL